MTNPSPFVYLSSSPFCPKRLKSLKDTTDSFALALDQDFRNHIAHALSIYNKLAILLTRVVRYCWLSMLLSFFFKWYAIWSCLPASATMFSRTNRCYGLLEIYTAWRLKVPVHHESSGLINKIETMTINKIIGCTLSVHCIPIKSVSVRHRAEYAIYVRFSYHHRTSLFQFRKWVSSVSPWCLINRFFSVIIPISSAKCHF